jgi:hypothetical protein
MATGLDYRRTDQRTNVLANPFWITSGEIVGVDAEDKAAMLFSFPMASRITVVHDVCVQVTTGFSVGAGAVVMSLGLGTIATDAITTAGTVTDSDVKGYFEDGDVTWATPGYYFPVTNTTGNTVSFLTGKNAGTLTDACWILGAASTTKVVCMYLTNAGGAITAGKCRVHMLISNIPGF